MWNLYLLIMEILSFQDYESKFEDEEQKERRTGIETVATQISLY